MSYPGAALPGDGSGGSHLGVGGQYQTSPVGSTYGSVYRPQEPGGGGDHATRGGLGGGVVRLVASNLTVASGGSILANGTGFTNDHWQRGGAGGSVWITVTGAISGDGVIEARGGISGATGGTLTLDDTAPVAAGDLWQGVYRFDNLTQRGDHRLDSEDPIRVGNLREIWGSVLTRTLTGHDLILRAGAVLSLPPSPDPSTPDSLLVALTGDLTIESGAAIDVTGQGYGSAMGYPGATAPGDGSGGSHLGVGGQYQTSPVGSTFGSVYRPQEAGGAGDHATRGGLGGGVVRLVAANLTVASNASILANGTGFTNDHWQRGGAGGSVWITLSGAISGDGEIEARGGVSGANLVGAGGGGVIAIEYASATGSILSNLRVSGGATSVAGGSGTLYLRSATSTYGELVIDNDAATGGQTVLPALGAGVAQTGSAGDVLVLDLASVPAYFVGHWVEVSAADSTVKGTWRIASVSGATVTLEPASNETISAVPGDLWRGVYLFDAVTVTGGASLTSSDPVIESGVELDLSSSFGFEE